MARTTKPTTPAAPVVEKPKRIRKPAVPPLAIAGVAIVDKGIRGPIAGPDVQPVQEDTDMAPKKLDVRTCVITDPHTGPRRAAVIVLADEPGDATTPAVVELVELPQPSRWTASAVAFD